MYVIQTDAVAGRATASMGCDANTRTEVKEPSTST